MGGSLSVLLHPLDELRVIQRLAHSASWNEQDVCRRTIGEGVIRHKLLAKGGANWIALFRHTKDSETSLAEDFPRSGIIDHFCAIEQEHSYADPLLFIIDFLDQFHPAART